MLSVFRESVSPPMRSGTYRVKVLPCWAHGFTYLIRPVEATALIELNPHQCLGVASGCFFSFRAATQHGVEGIQQQVLEKHLLPARQGVFVLPNVRAKRATTAGRQARDGENVPRTTSPGLVACRWRSG